MDLDGTNDLDDALHDGVGYYEHICMLTSRISKALYCSCFVASIIYFCFQLFASSSLFYAYAAFLGFRLACIIIGNCFWIYRLKRKFKSTQAVSYLHSEAQFIKEKNEDN
jgi:hypothetical protein